MAIDDKRRAQNREAQRKFRQLRAVAMKSADTKVELTRGLCAALRSAVRNGRDEFRPLLSEDDAETITNLANYLAGIGRKPRAKRPSKEKERGCV